MMPLTLSLFFTTQRAGAVANTFRKPKRSFLKRGMSGRQLGLSNGPIEKGNGCLCVI